MNSKTIKPKRQYRPGNSRNLRNEMLAKIHCEKERRGLSDEDYRGVLREVYGVDSAADLRNDQLEDLLDRWSGKTSDPETESQWVGVRKSSGVKGRITQLQINHIRRLWSRYASNPCWETLEKWLEKYLKISNITWMTVEKASLAIVVLEYELKRLGK